VARPATATPTLPRERGREPERRLRAEPERRRLAGWAVLALLGALALTACGGPQRRDTPSAALIQFDSNVADAEVWIDGSFYAGALARGIKVKPGSHRVEIRHDDYHTQYLELELAAGEERTVEVRLAEILP